MQTFYSIYYLINCALRRAHFKIWSKMVDALRLHMRIKQAEKYAGGRENGLIVAYRPNSCPASDFFSSGHEWTDYCIWAESIPRVELPLFRTRVAPTTFRRSQPTLSMAYKSKSIRTDSTLYFLYWVTSMTTTLNPFGPTPYDLWCNSLDSRIKFHKTMIIFFKKKSHRLRKISVQSIVPVKAWWWFFFENGSFIDLRQLHQDDTII